MHHVHSGCRPEEGVRSLQLGFRVVVSHLVGAGDQAQGPLQEQQLPFVTGAPLQIFIQSGYKPLTT